MRLGIAFNLPGANGSLQLAGKIQSGTQVMTAMLEIFNFPHV